jgi:cytochrome c-type biogenesis protein CcmH/NrfG
MTPFLLWAALLAVGGALALGLPLLRKGLAGRSWITGALALLLLLGGGGALYPLLSNYSWQHAEARAKTEATAGIPALLAATEARANDVAAWNRLGEGYTHIREWGPAIRAFDRANVLARGRDVAALTGLGQALLQTGDEQRVDQAIKLFEQALVIDPQSEVALVYTAVYYMQAGKPQLARDRFAAMLATNPPEAVQAALKKQLDALDQQLAEARAAAAAAIHLEVSLAPEIAAQAPAGASLFVFVPSPGGGPPLAVKRVAGPLPQQLSLSGADAMIAGHGIKAGDAVKVVARLSKGGTPTASPGDPFGEAQARVGAPGTIKIVIDQVTPAK